MDMDLFRKLAEYGKAGAYPLHMPGHKRNTGRYGMEDLYGLDITEIEGFDDLHEPEGILREGMERAARVYGSDEAWYLVNGSTAGILAGICACTKPGDRVLITRNCHKSVYHAMMLNRLEPLYLMPEPVPGWPVMGAADPGKAEEILAGESGGGSRAPEGEPREGSAGQRRGAGISLVVVTSPTYEGILSDIPAIAEACHRHGIPLLVDEAHGAHLGFGGFPEGAVAGGADLVVQSLHKTLPALTQTGLLHRQGNLVGGRRVKKYLDMFQSSSPSYLLMAGIDRCVRMLEEGTAVPAGWMEMLDRFYADTADLQHLRVLRADRKDPSKLVIGAGTGHTGPELMEVLRRRYHFEPEMTSAEYIIAMTGAGDRPEEIRRLSGVLREIDREWGSGGQQETGVGHRGGGQQEHGQEQRSGGQQETGREQRSGGECRGGREPEPCMVREAECAFPLSGWRPKPVIPPAEAEGLPGEAVPLAASAAGRVSLEFAYIYPPGVPVLAPGEEITPEVLAVLDFYRDAGIRLRGLSRKDGSILCIAEKAGFSDQMPERRNL